MWLLLVVFLACWWLFRRRGSATPQVAPVNEVDQARALLRQTHLQPGLCERTRRYRGRGGRMMQDTYYSNCIVCQRYEADPQAGVHIGKYNVDLACVPAFLRPFLWEHFILLYARLPLDIARLVVSDLMRCCVTEFLVRPSRRPVVKSTTHPTRQTVLLNPPRLSHPPTSRQKQTTRYADAGSV